VTGFSKGIRKVEVALRWDPSPAGQPPADLDVVAGTYPAGDPYGDPSYVVHFDSRSPDGTIYLNRDSKDGKGFGYDEVMTLELERLDAQPQPRGVRDPLTPAAVSQLVVDDPEQPHAPESTGA